MALRLKRSTSRPGESPTSRLGAAVAISIRPTLMAELVSRKTQDGSRQGGQGRSHRGNQFAGPHARKVGMRKTAKGEERGRGTRARTVVMGG